MRGGLEVMVCSTGLVLGSVCNIQQVQIVDTAPADVKKQFYSHNGDGDAGMFLLLVTGYPTPAALEKSINRNRIDRGWSERHTAFAADCDKYSRQTVRIDRGRLAEWDIIFHPSRGRFKLLAFAHVAWRTIALSQRTQRLCKQSH